LELLCSTFFSSALYFLAKQFQLYALSSRKKGGVVRASQEVLYELQFFVELLHGGVCGAEFVEQCQTPPKFRNLIKKNKLQPTPRTPIQ
jgi:hypothetical protein